MTSLPPDTWSFVHHHHAWFTTDTVDFSYVTLALFAAKLTEELGEFAETQAPGTNPKTQAAFSLQDAAHELCDITTTALMALCEAVEDPETFAEDPEAFYAHYTTSSDARQCAATLCAPMLLTALAVQIGRVGDALSGVTGFTPRKRVYCDDAELATRLCAVAHTSTRGLGLLVEDPGDFMAAHLQRGEARRLAAMAPPPSASSASCLAPRGAASR